MMGVMAYWPVVAMGVSLGTAGFGGYLDLRDEAKDGAVRATAVNNRLDTVRDTLSRSLTTVAEEVDDLSESIDSNEEAIEAINRVLIERQGRSELELQRLRNDIEKQDVKLDQAIELLREILQE